MPVPGAAVGRNVPAGAMNLYHPSSSLTLFPVLVGAGLSQKY